MKAIILLTICLLVTAQSKLTLEESLALDVTQYTNPCADEAAFNEVQTRLGQWIAVMENPAELANDLAVLTSVTSLIEVTKTSIEDIEAAAETVLPEPDLDGFVIGVPNPFGDEAPEEQQIYVEEEQTMELALMAPPPVEEEAALPPAEEYAEGEAETLEIVEQPAEDLPPLDQVLGLSSFIQLKTTSKTELQSTLEAKVVESIFAKEFQQILLQITALNTQDASHDDLLNMADEILTAIQTFSSELAWANDNAGQFGDFIAQLQQKQADLAAGLDLCLNPPQFVQKDLTKLAPDTNDIQPESVILESIPEEVGVSAELEQVSFLQKPAHKLRKQLRKQ